MEDLLGLLLSETGLLAIIYLGLSLSYLLVFPALLYWYLQKRWYVASSIERLAMYFLVFLFFPGLLVLSPVLNLRPRRRTQTA
ncbi:NAD(P)H-quinone oxidoreductase subunit L [Synechocystis sp. PCC 7339]|uniref:NAD(P)H-quinone oxidoreductase subunit L n=1 Tax=Synechocystis TaxID=1142 RepID=UPI001881259C|nr:MULTISPECIES: NAD(P)H-quinone oxidoreductase subunit L [Synechocystis]MBE9202660.1 NAD(P)H-quinone oxidoreductase subunit L [Synechocystis salina LEGE 06099]QUS61543.1 NAD(P)H-quinone oxidoreductase subunit L [Synechocystis sp. PCC 7338]UAJ73709.1 NAD(P)H-quinone oxidoreductase subunit L [Synechocystis sp. PCC 7339]